ncbi:hypothetical protein ACIOVF_27840 [Pseudomonas sp. NPDC087612]|uniref:hypothetical protein n=1 Tax=Pseudomonas sp. NPDC087612 TaxID=3364441 RepID=UPI003809EE1E
MKKAVEQDTLAALIESGAAREFRATRGPGGEGWSLSTRLGCFWLPVRSRRELIRTWASLTALGRFCEGIGIRSLTVEM